MKNESVKSYEDVCKIKGIDPVASLPFPDPKTPEEKAINGFTKVIRTIEVLNGDWKPDWNNYNQPKYYPLWDMRSPKGAVVGSAAGFSYHGYDYDDSFSDLSSRLVLKDRKSAEHIAKYFIDDYRAFMVIEG